MHFGMAFVICSFVDTLKKKLLQWMKLCCSCCLTLLSPILNVVEFCVIPVTYYFHGSVSKVHLPLSLWLFFLFLSLSLSLPLSLLFLLPFFLLPGHVDTSVQLFSFSRVNSASLQAESAGCLFASITHQSIMKINSTIAELQRGNPYLS